jgi:tripartite-type tricarboxylate transporter receptor subunit TctC
MSMVQRLMVPVVALLLMLPVSGAAQDYPSKPVTFIVPYAPGGATDIFARTLATFMEKKWRQPVVVENRAGGSFKIAVTVIQKAAPDGHTIGIIAPAMTVGYLRLGEELKVGEAIDAVAQFWTSNAAYVVNTNVIPARSMDELIAYMKANPGTPYGTLSAGSINGMIAAHYFKSQGIVAQEIAYKGAAPAAQALLAGEVGVIAGADMQAATTIPRDNANVAVLATTAAGQAEATPGVKPVAETGYPELEFTTFGGIAVTHGTPNAVKAKLSEAVREAAADPEVIATLARLGATATFVGTTEFERSLRKTNERLAVIVQDLEAK